MGSSFPAPSSIQVSVKRLDERGQQVVVREPVLCVGHDGHEALLVDGLSVHGLRLARSEARGIVVGGEDDLRESASGTSGLGGASEHYFCDKGRARVG